MSLLQQVLAASDADADEERLPGEGPRMCHHYRLSFSKGCIILYYIGWINMHLF